VKIASGRILDRLPAEEACLGAFFSSYTFDPAFFEDHVLRSVLRLTSDPVEQAERYHHEARRALQETPVVAVVDAGERRPGRRLPFDLLEVSSTVFHPKAVLLLYREHARLMVGSGNLTFSGYGGNTELFLHTDLAYDDPAGAALLTSFDEHLGRVQDLVRRRGTQLDLLREELLRRLPVERSSPAASRLRLLDSTTRPIVEQLVDLLPADATIHSLGLLAPFYERDDARELDTRSVFGALAARATDGAVLDVGVSWDNPSVQATEACELEEGLGQVWTWVRTDSGTRVLEHLVPTSLGPRTLHYTDAAGQGRRCPLQDAHAAIEARTLWLQPAPVAFAPRNAIAAAAERFGKVRRWLHPATRFLDGRPVHRPLHAKLLVVGFRAGRTEGTLLLLGSPNMSRRALLMRAGGGQGNVELALAFRLDQLLELRDLVPELVHAPASAFELREREFPEVGPNYALAIDEASHDPRSETLRVTWSPLAAALPAWRLTYDGRELARSLEHPIEPVSLDGFVLQPATAEVVLHVDGREYPVPILVTDLVALPAAPAAPALGLEELLLLLARRIGSERAVQLAKRRAPGAGEGDDPSSFFGEGFGPTDVFRAWWAVAEGLSDPTLSVPGFRLRLEGSLGVGAAWSCMMAAAEDEGSLSVEEVWFYGAELLRTLGEVELAPADDREAKRSLLEAFRVGVRADLASLGLEVNGRPWVDRVLSFYVDPGP